MSPKPVDDGSPNDGVGLAGEPLGGQPARAGREDNTTGGPSHVVGIGASAGGIAALEAFFKAMPADSGMAFVVVLHLSADSSGLSADLLARHTAMPVRRVENGLALAPDEVYVIPPGQVMTTADGRLYLQEREGRQLVLSVDIFLESLATAMGARAVAVVLSGSGADGSRGVVAVGEAGGLVLAQSPDSAQFDGMPRAAISSGVCRQVATPSELPSALLAHARAPHTGSSPSSSLLVNAQEGEFAAIFGYLRRQFSLDFSKYKPATVARRIARRLEFRHLQRVDQYVEVLESDPHELDLLFSDLLIGVTEFFRDAEAFACLEQQVVPRLFEEATAGELRVWVAACATGEEAYSLAILLHEHASAVGYTGRISIFATDAHPRSLEVASAGLYGEAQLSGVTPERRARYFTPEGPGCFKVHADLRRMVIFAAQNLLHDPPIAKMDLVSCRNLLIYFLPEAQGRAVATLNFALRPNGVLFLASSEGLGVFADDFATISGHHKIFRKTRDVRLPLQAMDLQPRTPGEPLVRRPGGRITIPIDRHLLHDYDLLLARLVPAGVLLDERFHALHHFGDVAPYLRPPSGRTGNTLVYDVAPDLQLAVSVALQRAAATQARFTVPRVAMTLGADTAHVDVSVDVLPHEASGTSHFLVVFSRAEPAEAWAAQPGDPEAVLGKLEASPALRAHIADIETQLLSTRESLQATVEELQTSNEELQATNEELLAANEELQSTNEELRALNAKFETKNNELTALNRDHRHLLESLQTGVVFVDESFTIRRFNAASATAFKLLPQDIGRPIAHIAYLLDDQDHLLSCLSEVLATGRSVEMELQDKHGQWVLQRLVPYLDEQTAVKGVLLTCTDVTALKAAQTKLQTLFEVLPVGVAILDAEGEVVDANAATQRTVALERDALIRGVHKARQYVGHDGSAMPPEAFASTQAMRTRAAVFDVEVGIMEGGEHVAWVTTSAAPLPDGGVVVVTADITNRKRSELALKRWADIFQNVCIGVVVGSPDGKAMELSNPAFAAMHGYTQEELAGAPITSIFAPESRAELPAHIRLANESGHHTFESMHLRRDGTSFPVLVSVVAVNDDAGRGLRRIVTVQDLTEQRRAEEALRRSQKLEALGVLAGGVAHDFNNILVAIRGNAMLAAAAIGADDPLHRFLNEIDQAGRRAAGVVAQILAFARPSEAKRSKTFLRVVVLEALHLLRAAIPARITVETTFPEPAVAVAVDAGELHQVVVNLVSNAAHAIGANAGTVSVRVDTTVVGDAADLRDELMPGRYVRLMVEDDGAGMDATTLARACDPFFTTKDPGNGTGLGLAIVYGIMKSHQGGMRLQSEPGRGTVVTLLFPAAADAETAVSTDAMAPAVVAPSEQRLRALVVDDDEAILRFMKRLLTRSGYSVTAFPDPLDAIELLEKDPSSVDFIITDLSMPTMSGLEVARHVRRIRPDLPVIVSSGYVHADDDAELARIGIDGVILKPGTVDQLAHVLSKVLSGRPSGA